MLSKDAKPGDIFEYGNTNDSFYIKGKIIDPKYYHSGVCANLIKYEALESVGSPASSCSYCGIGSMMDLKSKIVKRVKKIIG